MVVDDADGLQERVDNDGSHIFESTFLHVLGHKVGEGVAGAFLVLVTGVAPRLSVREMPDVQNG